jgi:hypothetical protein
MYSQVFGMIDYVLIINNALGIFQQYYTSYM